MGRRKEKVERIEDREALFARVAEILGKTLGIPPEEIREDSRIAEELGADSVDAVEILAALEEEYGCTVEDEEILSFQTPGDILDRLLARES